MNNALRKKDDDAAADTGEIQVSVGNNKRRQTADDEKNSENAFDIK